MSDSCVLKILVAEDDRMTRLAMDRLVEALGHDVVAVTNGKEVLNALREGSFDLILMDDQMPILSGTDATKAIRRGEAGIDATNVHIIALTASTTPLDERRMLEAGMDEYIPKPVDMHRLQERLEAFITVCK